MPDVYHILIKGQGVLSNASSLKAKVGGVFVCTVCTVCMYICMYVNHNICFEYRRYYLRLQDVMFMDGCIYVCMYDPIS